MAFDEHDNGQLRIGAQGDQIPLLALPAEGIPVEHERTPAEEELERRGREDAYLDDPCPCGAVLAGTGEPASFVQCGCTLVAGIRESDRRPVREWRPDTSELERWSQYER